MSRLLIAAPILMIVALAAAVGVAFQAGSRVQLELVARDGARTMLGEIPGDAFSPRLSPDGRQVSYQSGGAVWIADANNLASRRQFKPMSNVSFPVWQDAGRMVFIGTQGHPSLYSAAVDAIGGADLLVDVARAPDVWSVVDNGVSFITLKGDDYDIWFYSAATKQVTPLVVIPGTRQLSSQISADGKWVAYKSDETGSFEIWVQPFPAGPRTRVTTTGGSNPHWSPDGRELFYDDGHQLFAVAVTSQTPFKAGMPQPLPITGFVQAGSLRRHWDVTADGRFLVMVR